MRNRCGGCLKGSTARASACCGEGQTCDGGICVCDVGICYVSPAGNAIVRRDDACDVPNHDDDCVRPTGATCFCASAISADGAIVDAWDRSICVISTPRLDHPNGCCPVIEDYRMVGESEFACKIVLGDDPGNCGTCGQSCPSPRGCEAGSCNCNEDWCDHYCASDAAEWLCAELQDGTIIEACADGYISLSPIACDSDDDCTDQHPAVPTIGGGCIKKAFISHSPGSYSTWFDGGFCSWFTVYGASTCA